MGSNDDGSKLKNRGKTDDGEILNEAFNQKKIIRSKEIFGDKKEVIIIHGSESYRLLLTKNGKLILIK